jgi:hypothetical protein
MLLGALLSPLKQLAQLATGGEKREKKAPETPPEAVAPATFQMSPELAEERLLMPASNNWSGASLDQLAAPLAPAYGMSSNRYDHSAQGARLEDKYMAMFTPAPDARQMAG